MVFFPDFLYYPIERYRILFQAQAGRSTGADAYLDCVSFHYWWLETVRYPGYNLRPPGGDRIFNPG